MIHVGDCLEVLKTLEDNSIDAMVTDPPAGVAFMGKAWDGDKGGRRQWVEWLAEIMGEALRVLKPGGHAVVWSLPRTSHWTGWALEDAGFEVRDCGQVLHAFGSGFPKSAAVDKLIDRRRDDRDDILRVTSYVAVSRDRAGLSNADIDQRFGTNGMAGHWTSQKSQPHCPTWDQWLMLKTFIGLSDEMDAEVWRLNGRKGKPGDAWDEREITDTRSQRRLDGCSWQGASGIYEPGEKTYNLTAPATPEAVKWEGFGSAIKPSHEGWWLVRKPLDGTIAANVLKWGVGAINIDGCRVDRIQGGRTDYGLSNGAPRGLGNQGLDGRTPYSGDAGRWPPNVLLMHAEGCTDARCVHGCAAQAIREQGGDPEFFPCFYQAKPSGAERNAGCDELSAKDSQKWNDGGIKARRGEILRTNHHPTVKPITLMRWLARLVTPPGGTVLDPFTGSGTTGCACPYEGLQFVGIEREPEYAEIARARIAWHEVAASRAIDPREEVIDGKPAQLGLFGS